MIRISLIFVCAFILSAPALSREPELKYFELVPNENFNPFMPTDNQRNPTVYAKGRIYNYSDINIKNFSVSLIFYDCEPSGKDCIVIGRDMFMFDESLHFGEGVPIPAGEARDFVRAIQEVPAARGTLFFTQEATFNGKSAHDLLVESMMKNR